MTAEVSEVVRARPRRARVACWIAAVVVLATMTLLATGLHGPTGDGPGYFQRGDQLAMIGLGVVTAFAILLFARPRVEADATGIRVRNVIGSYELPWQVVRGISFGRGTPWVMLDLQDDESVAVMAIQATDKEYAVRAARGLRALLAQSRESGATEPSGTP